MAVMTAKYTGMCRECGDAIRPGDRINAKRGEGAAHSECAPTAAEKRDRAASLAEDKAERDYTDRRTETYYTDPGLVYDRTHIQDYYDW